MPERGGYFYLCLNCGGVARQGNWSEWKYDYDGEHGPEGALIPNPAGDSDPLLECPTCGELHGDCHVGAGIEDGTEAECRAERARLLMADPDAYDQARERARLDARALAEGRLRAWVNAPMTVPLARVIEQAFAAIGTDAELADHGEVLETVTILTDFALPGDLDD